MKYTLQTLAAIAILAMTSNAFANGLTWPQNTPFEVRAIALHQSKTCPGAEQDNTTQTDELKVTDAEKDYRITTFTTSISNPYLPVDHCVSVVRFFTQTSTLLYGVGSKIDDAKNPIDQTQLDHMKSDLAHR